MTEGVSYEMHYDHKNVEYARKLRKEMTPWERKLWYEFLRYYPVRFQRQKCIDNYIFRSYVKSLTAECDGLQIYDGKTLIADVEVPKGLNVIGKIGDWYYSELVRDEPSMKMWVYRFRIK